MPAHTHSYFRHLSFQVVRPNFVSVGVKRLTAQCGCTSMHRTRAVVFVVLETARDGTSTNSGETWIGGIPVGLFMSNYVYEGFIISCPPLKNL